MGCKIHSLNPQFLHKRIDTTTKHRSMCFSFRPNSELLCKNTVSSSYYNKLHDQEQVSTATTIEQTQIPISDMYNVKFKTLGASKLGISRYPDFVYNAEGGSGSGTATRISETESNGEVSVDFDIKQLYIPPLSTATTKFLGLPLPPFLRIDIVPETFQGRINQESGKVELKFRAKFCFSVGSVYKAQPLLVETVLTSEESKGKVRGGRGQRLDEDGLCRLVGVATVEPINNVFMDTFLSLPTECLADLNAIILFSSTA